MTHMRTFGLLVAALVLGAASTPVVQRVRVAGIPATETLTYTGYLESETGTPVTTEQMIGLAVYDSAAAGNKVCDVEAKAITPIGGRFQIQLPDTCVAKISANTELWVEVYVAAIGLGRTKLGAVPYAVEAEHAASADNASASGALATSIAALASKAEVPVITAWAAYTLEVTNDGGAAPAQTSTGQWRRVGDTIEVNISSTINACTGTGQVRWSIPAGLTVDSTKLTHAFAHIGSGNIYYQGNGKIETIIVAAQRANGFVVVENPSVGAGGLSCALLATPPPLLRMQFSLPIQGWSIRGA